jgi:hypothetical protein
MTDKRLLKKIELGIADEKDGIKYYGSYTPNQKEKLGKTGTEHLSDAQKDEREHLAFLRQDKKTISRRRP